MKIVIGGASSVGKSLVGYLSLGNNDIVVVAEDAEKLPSDFFTIFKTRVP